MDNKLSELSKPVMYSITCNGVVEEIGGDSQGFVREEVQAELDSWENGNVGIPDGYSVSALYSQEYVSALIKRAERLDSILTESVQALKAAEQRIAELERANTSQDDHINQQQDRIDSLEKKNAGLGQRLGDAEKRLATPVRLPEPCVYEVNGTRFYDRLSEAEVIASLREQGFTVEGG